MKLIGEFRRIILITAAVLLAALTFQWFVIEHSFYYLPNDVSLNSFNYASLLLFLSILAIAVYFFQRKCLRVLPQITLAQLTSLSILTCLIAEFIFNVIKQAVEPDTIFVKILFVLINTLTAVVYSAAISYMVALRNIRPKSMWNWFLPVIFLAIILLIKAFTGLL